MRLRNWLLTGTSLTILAFAPLGAAHAQDAADPNLTAAYQAYVAAQAGGDATASDAAKQTLTEACIAAGFASLDDCIAALSGQTAVDAAPPAEAPAAEAPAAEAPAAEAPAAEAPAAPAEPAAEAPAAPAEPAAEAPAAPAEQPAAEAPAAPVEQPAAEAPAAPAEPAVSEAPAAPVEAAPAAPSSEEAAPVAPSSEEAAPVSSAEPAADVLGQLTAAADLYNEGAADLDAGNADGQAKVDQAKGQIDAICSTAGFTDTDACLAQFGLSLNPLPPAQGEQPAASSETPAVSSEAAPSSEEAQTSEQPISELPNASEVVDENAVEPLPADVAPSEAAPILDSEKDATTTTTSTEPAPADTSSEAPAAPAEPVAPPADDKAAQQDIQPPPPEKQLTETEKGQKNADFVFVEPTPPGGDVKVVEKPKNDNGGFVFQIGVNFFINNPTQERDRFYDRNRGDEIYYEDLSRGRVRETITRRDGVRIVTIYDRYGDVLARSKFLPNGREIYLASYYQSDESQDDQGFWRDPGEDLPPLRLTISAGDYILDADTADEDRIEFFLDQPPVEQVRRIYTIDEVKRSARIRDTVRRLEVGGLTFDSGKATISRDQVGSLSKVAKAMQVLLEKNPGEVFLVEGHTDAVGDDVPNLVLSDERAATVARILTDFYEIPPENLVTQGYGERYLKVNTESAEELNRRVTIKRITPLVSYTADNG